MTTSTASQSWTAYSSCEVLPLSVFIDCLLDGEYDKLITSETTPEERESEAYKAFVSDTWLNLYSEYCQLSGDDAMAAILMQVWDLKVKASRIKHVKMLLEGLLKYNEPTIIEILALRGYIVQPYTNDAQWEQQLRRLKAQLQGEEYQLKKMDEVLQSLKSGETTKSDFRRQLIIISKQHGYKLRIEELFVADYCEYLKLMREEYEQQLNAQNNGG